MRRWWCLAALCVGCASPAIRQKARAPSHWLELGNDESTSQNLSVVLVTPEGKAESNDAVSVVFNHPLRPMSIAEDVRPPAITVEPKVLGAWQWDGTNAVTLVGPSALLSPATKYRVTVSGSARDIHGHQLVMPHVYDFETERPRLVAVFPVRLPPSSSALSRIRSNKFPSKPDIVKQLTNLRKADPDWLCRQFGDVKGHAADANYAILPSTRIGLRFSLPMDIEELKRHVVLSASPLGDSDAEAIERIPFALNQPCPEDGSLVELVPALPLPKASHIHVTALPSLRSRVGPLDAGEQHAHHLHTYGKFSARYEFSETSSPNCRGPIFAFSNSVAGGLTAQQFTVAPAVQLSLQRWGTRSSDEGYCLEGGFKPHTTYRISLDRGTVDSHGQLLTGKTDWSFEIPKRNLPPLLGLAASQGQLELASPVRVPVRTLDAQRIEVKTIRMQPAMLAAWLPTGQDEETLSNYLASQPGRTQRFEANGRNWSGTVDLGAELEPQRFGGIGMRVQADGGPAVAQYLHRTDLALSGVLSPKRSLLWATRLTNGHPVADARVVALRANELIDLGRTDRDGVLEVAGDPTIHPSEPKHAVLVVAKGEDWSYLDWRSYEEAPNSIARYAGALVVDRGIYRPEERVHVKGWIQRRTDAGRVPLRDSELEVLLRCEAMPFEKRAIVRQKVQTNEYGAFYAAFTIPKAAPLGEYTAVAELSGESFATELRVGEYRSIEYRVSTEPSRTSAIRGEAIQLKLAGQYLFGPPLRHGQVEYQVQREPTRLPIFDQWVADAFTDLPSGLADLEAYAVVPGSDQGHDHHAGTTTLDERGQHLLDLSALGVETGPSRMRFSAGVKDLSQQVVRTDASLVVHPAAFYLALKPHTESAKLSSQLFAEVASFDPNGRRIAGKRAQIEFRRRDPDAVEGDTTEQASDQVVHQCEVTTELQRLARCGFQARKPGNYLILASGKDEQGRVMKAADSVAVFDTKSRERVTYHGVESVSVELDRTKYRPSESIRATVTVPWKRAQLLVTLETNRVLWHQARTVVDHAATLSIPIPSTVSDSARVTAYALTGRTGQTSSNNEVYDHQRPRAITGSAAVVIDPAIYRLELDVSPKTDVATPGSRVPVTIKVSDRAGQARKAEITLFAVDEGVLALTDQGLPDPLKQLLTEPERRLTFADSREHLARIFQFSGRGDDFGHFWGGRYAPMGAVGELEKSSGIDARSAFHATTYFNPHLVTNDQGIVEVEVPLGDAISSYRITAVAASEHGEMGAAETSVRTQLPLLLRAALPRYLRRGDHADARVLIMNQSDRPEDVTLTLNARGVGSSGPLRQRVHAEPHATTAVAFPIVANDGAKAELRFAVEGTGLRDALVHELRVESPSRMQTVASYGQTSSSATEGVADLSKVRLDQGGLSVQVSSTALVGLDRNLAQIADDDRPLTEGLVSQIITSLLLDDFGKTYGLSVRTQPESIDERLSKLLSQQHHDGCFTLWPGEQSTHAWLSVYALLALEHAVARKHHVAPLALKEARECAARWLNALTEEAANANDHTQAPQAARHPPTKRLATQAKTPRASAADPAQGIARTVGAFAAVALTMSHQISSEQLRALWSVRLRLPYYAQAQLLEALATLRELKGLDEAERLSMMKELSNSLLSSVHFDGPRVVLQIGNAKYPQSFDSPERTLALLLSALLTMDPRHPLAERMVHALLAGRQNGLWRSPQEAAFALLALDRYRRLREATPTGFTGTVWFENRLMGSVDRRGNDLRLARFDLPMKDVGVAGGQLRFAIQGQGTLHYETRLSYVPRNLPRDGLDRGFLVLQSLHRITPQTLPSTLAQGLAADTQEFALGDVVVGQIAVATPTARDFVVIEIPVPAGFECLDESLVTTYGLDRAVGSVVEANQDQDKAVPESHERARARLRRGKWPSLSPRLRGVETNGSPHVVHRELRDDRVVLYVQHLPRGAYRFHYAARATSAGKYVVPPAFASEIYTPEVFGRTGALEVVIR